MVVSKIKKEIRVLEASTLIDKIAVVLERNIKIGNSFVSTLATKARALTIELQSAINSTRVYSNLEEWDNLRDDSLRGLFNMVTGLSYFPDPQIKDGAKTILELLAQYGFQITQSKYDKESALIGKLLSDLSQPNVRETIALLPGVSDIIAEVATNQRKFEEASQGWNTARTKDGKTPTQIKKEVVVFINMGLIPALNAGLYLEEATYKTMALEIAGFIEATNRLIR